MRREVPAVVAIIRRTDAQVQTVYSCAAHKFAVIREFRKLGDEDLVIGKADPTHYGCKGCLDGWPP